MVTVSLSGDPGHHRQDPRGRGLGCCGGRLEVRRDGPRPALSLLLHRLHACVHHLGAGGGAPHRGLLGAPHVSISCGLSVANWSQHYYAGNYPRRLALWRIAFYTLPYSEGWGQTRNLGSELFWWSSIVCQDCWYVNKASVDKFYKVMVYDEKKIQTIHF